MFRVTRASQFRWSADKGRAMVRPADCSVGLGCGVPGVASGCLAGKACPLTAGRWEYVQPRVCIDSTPDDEHQPKRQMAMTTMSEAAPARVSGPRRIVVVAGTGYLSAAVEQAAAIPAPLSVCSHEGQSRLRNPRQCIRFPTRDVEA